MAELQKNAHFAGIQGPLLTIVMDGVGLAPANAANAIAAADTEYQQERACEKQQKKRRRNRRYCHTEQKNYRRNRQNGGKRLADFALEFRIQYTSLPFYYIFILFYHKK